MDAIQPSDFIPILLYFVLREGLPWIMRTAFPVWVEKKKDERNDDVEFRKFEMRMKEETILREAKLEERTAIALEGILGYIGKLNEVYTSTSAQLTALRAEVANMHDASQDYFAEGRMSMREIAIISSKVREGKSDKRKRV